MYPTKKLWETWNIIRWVSYSKWDLLEKFQEWCVTLLRANNINNWLNTDELQFLPKELINSEKILQKNDIIFCMSSWSRDLVWKNTIIPKIENYSFGAFCSALRLNKDINPYFISYFLQTTTYKNYIRNLWKWWNILNLRNSDLQNLPIPLPPLSTQKLIVEKLDMIFAEIEKSKNLLEKNLQNVDEMSKSVLEKIFTNDKWERKKLWEVINIIRWVTYKPENVLENWWIACFRTKNIQQKLYESDIVYIEKNIVKNPEKFLKNWDILVSSANSLELLWKCCLIENLTYEATLWWFITCFRSTEDINYKYFYYFYNSEKIQKIVRWFSRKTTWIANLQLTEVQNLPIPLPPFSEQQKIVEYLDNIFAENQKLKNLYQAQIKNLNEMKQSFLKKAFAGELV